MRWIVDATPWALYILEIDPVPTVQETEWATGPVSTCMKNLAPTRIRALKLPARSELLYRMS